MQLQPSVRSGLWVFISSATRCLLGRGRGARLLLLLQLRGRRRVGHGHCAVRCGQMRARSSSLWQSHLGSWMSLRARGLSYKLT